MAVSTGVETDLIPGAFMFTPTRGSPNQKPQNDAAVKAFVEGSTADGTTAEQPTPRSTSSGKSDRDKDSPKPKTKKPRVTLARGAACVNCRHRKLKCNGEKPCVSCARSDVPCQYEMIQRRRPRNVVLEERVVELENMLAARGVTVPPTQLMISMPANGHLVAPSNATTSGSSSSLGGTPRLMSEVFHHTVTHPEPVLTVPSAEIASNGVIELGLITLILPHTPYLLLPLHPQRFLYRLARPPDDARRPHPALLYILFAEATRMSEKGISPPTLPVPPLTIPGSESLRPPNPSLDPSLLLQYVRGRGPSFLDRAKAELNSGLTDLDRPFDLLRAAIGIARHLHLLGRSHEAWHIPMSQMVMACGLHRIRVPSPPSNQQHNLTPRFDFQFTDLASASPQMAYDSAFGDSRIKSALIPPPEDDVEVGERVTAFWAAMGVQWTLGVETSWTTTIPEDECTTTWPWGWGGIEPRPNAPSRFAIADLFDPSSELHASPSTDTTYILALKSLAILHRANRLFDLPTSSLSNCSLPSLSAIKTVETAINAFRLRLPFPFQDLPSPSLAQLQKGWQGEYDGFHDPWWITLHTNIYTAEMLMYRELAAYQRKSYDSAVSCARALVALVQRVLPEQWAHVGLIVPVNISLAARFLNKESQRLATSGQRAAAQLASDEAEFLRIVLVRDISTYFPVASEHALIVQRVKDGWPAKEREFERA